MSNVIAFPTRPPALPDYTHHQGRTIIWEPWIVSAQAICLGPRRCEHCGCSDAPLFASGRAQPLPGETFITAQRRRKGHTEGAAYRQVKVPAWPVYRLCAFRCPGCAHIDILDMDNDYEPVDPTRPTPL